MLESVREIRAWACKQTIDQSQLGNRARNCRRIQIISIYSKLVARLVKSWITCSTLLRVCDGLYVNKLSEVTGRGKHFNSSSSQLLRGNPTGRHMLKQYKFPELSIGASGDSDRYILYDNIRPRN